jgi:ATP phosphoribosyltransferase regulatory subunit
LHTRPDRPFATRDPLQFGAEIYGHAGLEADLEIIELALTALDAVALKNVSLDLCDARSVPALLSGVSISAEAKDALHQALASKDLTSIQVLAKELPPNIQKALVELVQMYGDIGVLSQAEKTFSAWPSIVQSIQELRHIAQAFKHVHITFDLADLRGYGYYSGVRFAMFVAGTNDALVRGGRYDEVGAVFGRKRPAVGFSLDLKELISAVPAQPLKAAIRAPWGVEDGLREALAQLRGQGETVVCAMPGHESEVDEFNCDRELVYVAGKWVVRDLPHS